MVNWGTDTVRYVEEFNLPKENGAPAISKAYKGRGAKAPKRPVQRSNKREGEHARRSGPRHAAGPPQAGHRAEHGRGHECGDRFDLWREPREPNARLTDRPRRAVDRCGHPPTTNGWRHRNNCGGAVVHTEGKNWAARTGPDERQGSKDDEVGLRREGGCRHSGR